MFYQHRDKLDLQNLKDICQQKAELSDYPHASCIEKNLLIYEAARLSKIAKANRLAVMNELHQALLRGPGVFVVKQFYADAGLMQQGTRIFEKIILKEQAANQEKGDHFSKGNPNVRIWNSFEKMLYQAPDYFIEYYGNPLYSLVCESWLGPGYQITAQVNLTKPGSQPQIPHRDYHLGFQNKETIQQYPLTVQKASQLLTLQGGIAHVDVPLESGPTCLLPFSQSYPQGYLQMHEPELQDFCSRHFVQIPLEAGDALFFSPALFHGAGENKSQNINRMVNLLQISSAFGRPMEQVNRAAMVEFITPLLQEKLEKGKIPMRTPDFSQVEVEQVVKSVACGYPFPTNLDVMQPKKGHNTPATEQDTLIKKLEKK